MCTALKEWEAEIRSENEEQMKQMTVLLQEAEERAGQAEERASRAEDRAEGYRAILLLHGIDPDESV